MKAGRLTIPTLPLLLAGLGITALATTRNCSPTEGIQEALSALADDDLARAERVGLETAEANLPGSYRAWLVVAAARQRQARYDQAGDAYRQFLSLCGSPVRRAYAAEQIRLCAAAAAPPKRPVPVSRRLTPQQRERLGAVEDRLFTESSEHFAVRARNAELAKLVAAQAEVALARICGTILSGQAYPHSVDVHVWATVTEYRKHAKSAFEWAGGSFSLRHGDDGQVVRRIDLTQLNDDRQFDVNMLDRILPHEICHLVLAEYFGDAHCPLPLNEGLAMMAEATLHHERIRLAAAALASDRKIPLQRLLAATRVEADHAAVFYAESHSLVGFLHAKLTARQFRDLLANLKGGCPFGDALQRALYLPPDEEFLPRLAQAWTAEAIRQGQFLKALDAGLSATR